MQSCRLLASRLPQRLNSPNYKLSIRTFFGRPSHFVGEIEGRVRQMERYFDRVQREMNSIFSPRSFFQYPVPLHNNRYIYYPHVESEVYTEVKEGGNSRKYALRMDLGREFSAENLKISLKDRLLTVEGKFEEKSDDGSSKVCQQFTRQYTLPQGVNLQQVKSVITPGGLLTVEAPFQQPAEPQPKEIPISIQNDKQN